ncbi:MAG: AAA family ATPase, partial [Candidatus Magasanikbacteria bacterium]|nr:AAA family ATPase [Candidatus Magasanikbacteria bacterium]
MTQAQALAILKTGANVFLTGEPGAGKTHTINEYAAYLRARDIEPAVTASTGIAATHLGGMTIHSWSGIGIKSELDKRTLHDIANNKYIIKRVQPAKVLIIDEVSMLSPGTLAMVDAVCRMIKQNAEPFGGLQVIFVGDFFQLPPIIKKDYKDYNESEQQEFFEEQVSRFAFDSPAWERAKPVVCYLTEQYRQDDNVFLNILSAIRHNVFDDNHLRHLIARKVEQQSAPVDAPKLFSHNVNVDSVNEAMLDELPSQRHTFKSTSDGHHALVAVLQRGCLSPETLCLKIGAAVMFTKNNQREGFVNGTLGEVLGFDKESGLPIVRTRGGTKIEVEKMNWIIEENGEVRAQITQLPLRLAWAITVHKSQGMSLDEAVMDLSQVFEFGQGYVALSRVRRLAGLHLLGWNDRAFQVHPEVLAKDESFRLASQEAETMFAKISPAEMEQKHKDFISSSGGKEAGARATYFKAVKKKKKKVKKRKTAWGGWG